MKAEKTLKSFAKVAGLAAIATTAVAIAAPAGATVPGDNGKIVYAARQAPGNYDIYSVNPNGTAAAPLAQNAATELDPTVSPDGQKVAYIRAGDVWTMNIDGSGQAPLTQTQVNERDPAWSPDGKRIAFVVPTDGGSRLFVMDADGGNPKVVVKSYGGPIVAEQATQFEALARLAPSLDELLEDLGNVPPPPLPPEEPEPEKYYENDPAWSPDGKWIAFSSNHDGDYDIYKQRVGFGQLVLGGATKVADAAKDEREPSWSPNGDNVVYSLGAATHSHLWMTAADGTGSPERMSPNTGSIFYTHADPAFSPDGASIVYRRFGGDLWILDVASKTKAPLVTADSFDRDPDWQTLGFELPTEPEQGEGETPEGGENGGNDNGQNGNGQNGNGQQPKNGCTITGTPGDDVLVGTPGRDVICALGGDDVIRGLAGNDVIKAGPGDDLVVGGRGRDRLLGQSGEDTLRGNAGRDLMKAGAGDDELVGGKGRDRMFGQAGDDTFFALRGGRDIVKGGKGFDEARFDRALDVIRSIEAKS